MRTKRTIIVFLVAVNVLIAAALVSSSRSLPQAMAQAAGRGGDFLCVTAKPAGQSYEVLYMIDLAQSRLHAFYPEQTRRQLVQVPPRDLLKDFVPQQPP